MDEKKPLLERKLTPVLNQALNDTPVVILLGPRQSGKTTLATMHDPERPLFTLDETALRTAAQADPDRFVQGLPDRVTIDEVQRVPSLLTAIKLSVDRDRRPGRFLLTGSANLLMLPKVTESLAGRMEIARLETLTEAEKCSAPGQFLNEFLVGFSPSIHATRHPLGMDDWPARIIAGGYPEPQIRTPPRARQWHRQYLRGLLEQDVQDVARVQDSVALSRLFETIALNTGSLLNAAQLSRTLGLHRSTVDQYLLVLERLFLLRRLPAWHRNAARRLVKAPKLHVSDSGLAATLADVNVDDWPQHREMLGHLLESFVVQQLMAQAAWTDPDLRFWHYRDKDKVEVDLVITKGRRTWGIEVKSATSVQAKDGAGLLRLAEQCGEDFQQGIVLYTGRDSLPMRDKRLLAVPISALWER